MADIDHFKEINDDYGHHVGDVSLQKVAHVLRSTVRASDHVYRYGGEEFVIVFLDCDAESGRAQAERVRLAIESTPLTGDDMQPIGPVTISIGLAALPDHGTDIDSLIGLADDAMYCAKDDGRNRVVVYGSARTRLHARGLAWSDCRHGFSYLRLVVVHELDFEPARFLEERGAHLGKVASVRRFRGGHARFDQGSRGRRPRPES